MVPAQLVDRATCGHATESCSLRELLRLVDALQQPDVATSASVIDLMPQHAAELESQLLTVSHFHSKRTLIEGGPAATVGKGLTCASLS
jgi:hypothetical protein